MPPMRGASGWMMSAAPASIRRTCSATLASISPVAIGVSSAAGQVGVALGVVRVQRLLDPDQAELLEDPPHPHARSARSHCWLASTISGTSSSRCSRTAVTRARSMRAVRLADLELDAADAGLQRRGGVLQHLLDRGVQEPAGGVVGAHRVPVATRGAWRAAARRAWPSGPTARRRRRRSPGSPARCGPPRRRPSRA